MSARPGLARRSVTPDQYGSQPPADWRLPGVEQRAAAAGVSGRLQLRLQLCLLDEQGKALALHLQRVLQLAQA